MNENWCALYVAIIKKTTPEQAFLLLNKPNVTPNALNKVYSEEDTQDMLKLKEEYTYKELAEIYCMGMYSVFNRIMRHKSDIA